MPQDPKLRSLPSGKFTRVFAGGSPVFDESGVYAVTTALLTEKGSYYWDESGQLGTRIHAIVNESSGTAATLSAQGQDALRQVQQLGLISDFRSEARRLQTGRWSLRLAWTVAGQQVAPLTLNL